MNASLADTPRHGDDAQVKEHLAKDLSERLAKVSGICSSSGLVRLLSKRVESFAFLIVVVSTVFFAQLAWMVSSVLWVLLPYVNMAVLRPLDSAIKTEALWPKEQVLSP